jgi:hypothetical protein
MFILLGVSRLTNISIAVLVQMMAQQSERGLPESFQKTVPAFPALASNSVNFQKPQSQREVYCVKPDVVELIFDCGVAISSACQSEGTGTWTTTSSPRTNAPSAPRGQLLNEHRSDASDLTVSNSELKLRVEQRRDVSALRVAHSFVHVRERLRLRFEIVRHKQRADDEYDRGNAERPVSSKLDAPEFQSYRTRVHAHTSPLMI